MIAIYILKYVKNQLPPSENIAFPLSFNLNAKTRVFISYFPIFKRNPRRSPPEFF